jgi:hypothetical protein
MALVLAVVVLSRPVLGSLSLWARRQLAERSEGDPVYAASEIMAVVL